MRILYIGPDSGTCRQRRLALERLGHEPFLVNPFEGPLRNRKVRAWSFRTGALGLAPVVQRQVLGRIGGREFDVALVDSGEVIGLDLVRALKRRASRVINYNPDHPFAGRDGARWRLFLKALPHYDLFVTPRRSSAEAAIRAGARRVIQTDFAADELVHRPRALSDEAKAAYASQVAFVGTWMPERGPFLAELVRAGVPLKIFGPRWSKAPELAVLRPHLVEGELGGEAYADAIRASRIALGLLSKGNEDLHTTRSMEVPALGALLCAERTDDHLAMYREGEEAVFWSDAQECAAKCLELLSKPDRIDAIAAAGLRRVRENRSFNEPLMAGFIAEAMRTDARDGEIVAHPTLVDRALYEAADAPAARRAGQA